MTGDPFETAVDALIAGDLSTLGTLLGGRPELVRRRSARPHHATLLHYLAANGVEDERQRSPANAPEAAKLLLDRGADPDALADMYGGRCTTLSMLVSSTPPAVAGVQVPLVDVLVDAGASVEALGSGAWASPLMTALVFGFRDAADALVRRGARVDTLPLAAGVRRVDDVRRMLADATANERHRALALAAQLGFADVVSLLLDAGEDPDRFNPPGMHAHGTPLHHAAAGGHLAVVRLLVERGARVDRRDTIWRTTPLGWAEHESRADVADYLRGAGAC